VKSHDITSIAIYYCRYHHAETIFLEEHEEKHYISLDFQCQFVLKRCN